MSDFFSAIYSGIKQPDTVMNQGPLPPTNTAGMPVGYNGTPDAKIDYTSSLLGDVQPYAYGEGARLTTQTAYLNIPHTCQRIVPMINLPDATSHKEGGSFFHHTHQVGDGEVAFVVRAMFSPYDLVVDKKKYNRSGVLHAIDPVVNLATANFILHGLQRHGYKADAEPNWNTLWLALDIDNYFEKRYNGKLSQRMKAADDEIERINALPQRTELDLATRLDNIAALKSMRRTLCEHVVKNLIVPFGVPRASDRQGGQHQGVNMKSVTYPVDFVVAMVIDGKTINLSNSWRQHNFSSGDDLIYYLEDCPTVAYNLSHHPKSMRKQTFGNLNKWEVPRHMVAGKNMCDDSVRAMHRLYDLIYDVATRRVSGGRPGAPVPPAPGEPYLFREGASTAAGPANRLNSANPAIQAAAKLKNKKDWGNVDNVRLLPREAMQAFNRASRYFSTTQDLVNFVNTAVFEDADKPMSTDSLVRTIERLEAYYKENRDNGMPRKTRLSEFEMDKMVAVDETIYQLLPGVTSSCLNGVQEAIWRHGYWHIARSQVMSFAYDEDLRMHSDATVLNRGALLEATFAPVWTQPLEVSELGGGASDIAASFAVENEDMRSYMRRKRVRRAMISETRIEVIRNAMDAFLAEYRTARQQFVALETTITAGYPAAGTVGPALNPSILACIAAAHALCTVLAPGYKSMLEEMEMVFQHEADEVFAPEALSLGMGFQKLVRIQYRDLRAKIMDFTANIVPKAVFMVNQIDTLGLQPGIEYIRECTQCFQCTDGVDLKTLYEYDGVEFQANMLEIVTLCAREVTSGIRYECTAQKMRGMINYIVTAKTTERNAPTAAKTAAFNSADRRLIIHTAAMFAEAWNKHCSAKLPMNWALWGTLLPDDGVADAALIDAMFPATVAPLGATAVFPFRDLLGAIPDAAAPAPPAGQSRLVTDFTYSLRIPKWIAFMHGRTMGVLYDNIKNPKVAYDTAPLNGVPERDCGLIWEKLTTEVGYMLRRYNADLATSIWTPPAVRPPAQKVTNIEAGYYYTLYSLYFATRFGTLHEVQFNWAARLTVNMTAIFSADRIYDDAVNNTGYDNATGAQNPTAVLANASLGPGTRTLVQEFMRDKLAPALNGKPVTDQFPIISEITTIPLQDKYTGAYVPGGPPVYLRGGMGDDGDDAGQSPPTGDEPTVPHASGRTDATPAPSTASGAKTSGKKGKGSGGTTITSASVLAELDREAGSGGVDLGASSSKGGAKSSFKRVQARTIE